MEEKILIKSEKYNVILISLIIAVVCIVLAMILIPDYYMEGIRRCADNVEEYKEDVEYYQQRVDSWSPSDTFDSDIFDYDYFVGMLAYAEEDLALWKEYYRYDVREYIAIVFLPGLALAAIIYFWLASYAITVSNKRVYGKAAFGRRVDLPMDSVSAVGARWPKGIAVSTSSGKIAFLLIKNRDEIYQTISNLLIERQQIASNAETPVIKQEIQQSRADELKKFKELFDAGIITQEEFDAKKKQLLGL